MVAYAKSITGVSAYDKHESTNPLSRTPLSLSYVYIKTLINYDFYLQSVWAVVWFAQSTTNFQM